MMGNDGCSARKGTITIANESTPCEILRKKEVLASLVSLHVSHVHRLVGYKLRRLGKWSSR